MFIAISSHTTFLILMEQLYLIRMRCFLAVDVPEEIKRNISRLQQELTGLDTKLVEKENLHFTLKFFGELDEEKMKAVVKRVETIATMRCTVSLKGIGFFPNRNFIRVVWIGAESQEFLNLHIAINEALADFFEKEKPVPHLTLARVRSQLYRTRLQEFGDRHQNEEFGIFEVTQIKLKRSTVTRMGPVYEDVKVWDLHDNG